MYNQSAPVPTTTQMPLKSALKKPLPSPAQPIAEPVATTAPGGYQKGNEFVPVRRGGLYFEWKNSGFYVLCILIEVHEYG